MRKIGVLVSGRGTNLQALLDAESREELSGQIVVVPSSQANQGMSALSRNDKAYRLGVIEKSKKGVVEIKPYEVRIE